MTQHIPWKVEFNLKPNNMVSYLVPGDGHYNRKRHKNSLSNLHNSSEYYQDNTPVPTVINKTLTIADLLDMDDETFESSWTTETKTLRARTDGCMSSATQRKLRHLVDHFVAICPNSFTYSKANKKWYKFKLNFITLTLPTPQMHTDNLIKKVCLQSFIDKLRKIHGVKHYIWKSELQQNGNIHFHITTNRFIPYSDIRDLWLLALNKLGYADHYIETHGSDNPPCTEIRSVKNLKNVGKYLSSYMAKNPNKTKEGKEIGQNIPTKENERISCIWKDNGDGTKSRKPITGKVYGASESLTKLKTFRVQEGDRGYHDLCAYTTNPKIEKFQMEKAVIWHVKLNQIVKKFPQHFADQIINHYRSCGLSDKESKRLAFCDPVFT